MTSQRESATNRIREEHKEVQELKCCKVKTSRHHYQIMEGARGKDKSIWKPGDAWFTSLDVMLAPGELNKTQQMQDVNTHNLI